MKAMSAYSILVSTLLMLIGCSSVKVNTDYDQTASFDKYQTYRLAPPSQGPSLSPSGEAALRETLQSSLAARGISESKEGNPDLDVVWHVFTQEQVSVTQYDDWGYARGGPWPQRYGTYRAWGGAPMGFTDVNSYLEGTLVLDFVDTGTSNLVFRGTGTGTVGSSKANAQSIREAVRRMIEEFPGR